MTELGKLIEEQTKAGTQGVAFAIQRTASRAYEAGQRDGRSQAVEAIKKYAAGQPWAELLVQEIESWNYGG